ncbi:hypothetical protein HPP92_026050, partial [Vanilla planifolia]
MAALMDKFDLVGWKGRSKDEMALAWMAMDGGEANIERASADKERAYNVVDEREEFGGEVERREFDGNANVKRLEIMEENEKREKRKKKEIKDKKEDD